MIFEHAAQDARYALRGLARSPGFTATVVLTFALGVGANAAVFSIIEPLLLRTPPGLVRPGQLHRVYHVGAGEATPLFSGAAYSAIREALAGQATVSPRLQTDSATMVAGDVTMDVTREVATAAYLPTLTGPPTLGRYFTTEEGDARAPLPRAVLSHAFWQSAFGGDRNIIGREASVGAMSYTIVGVAAKEFRGLDITPVDLWTTPVNFARFPEPWYSWNNPKFGSLVVRTNEGVDERSAAARATIAWRRTIVASAPADSMRSIFLSSIVEGRGPMASRELRIAGRLAGVAIIVLLVACGNIATLALLRAARRRRETAVRVAIGIARGRLVRQVLSETIVLALFGGAVAILFASWGGNVLRALLMPGVEFPAGVVGMRVVLAALGLSVMAGVLSGIAPAVQSSAPDLTALLKGDGRSGRMPGWRLRTLLLVGQSALSVVLIVGAGLFVRSLAKLSDIDIGLDPAQTIIVGVRPEAGGGASPTVFFPDLAKRVRGLEGTEHVSLATSSPFYFWNAREAYVPGSDTSVALAGELPGFIGADAEIFQALGARILAGRGIAATDVKGAEPVMVVSESMAKTIWPGQNAIGKCLVPFEQSRPCFTVVGVSSDINQWQLVEPPRLRYFIPYEQVPEPRLPAWSMIVRVSADRADAVAAYIRSAVRQELPTARVLQPIVPMSERLVEEYRPWKVGAGLFIALGSLALIVATIGVYSVLAYTLSQRTKELGVRMALGATAGDMRRLVVVEGLRPVAIGAAIGIILALVLGRLVSSLLYGVSSSDPMTLVVSVSVLIVAGLLAGLLPAWRASRVDPVVALRSE